MFHTIASVTPLPDRKLLAVFKSGEVKLYDAGKLKEIWPVFEDFDVIPGLFELVYVDKGGYGIVWNENLDLSCEEIWENGIPYKKHDA
ncbi:MAG: DUF2442 domain-containing protein [Oscillospiraceae bacterium]|nr:DUF2442 domain-containing protein [Oscillospiraceae bacterium]